MLCTESLCRLNGCGERFVSLVIFQRRQRLRCQVTKTSCLGVQITQRMVGSLWDAVAWEKLLNFPSFANFAVFLRLKSHFVIKGKLIPFATTSGGRLCQFKFSLVLICYSLLALPTHICRILSSILSWFRIGIRHPWPCCCCC